MRANIENLENNKIKIIYNGEYKDFDRYINTLLFKFDNYTLTPCSGGGWISDRKLVDNLKTVLDITELNDYIEPEYMKIGQKMKLSPYEYQKEAIHFALNSLNTLMVLPCGSGKTPIIIGSYVEAKDRGLIKGQGLVIVKASLKMQWEKEVSKFSEYTGKAIETYSDLTRNHMTKIKRRTEKLSKMKAMDKGRKELANEINEIQIEADKKFNEQFNKADLLIANYETLMDERVLEKLKSMNIEFIGADKFLVPCNGNIALLNWENCGKILRA